jgi:transcription termination factor NusB
VKLQRIFRVQTQKQHHPLQRIFRVQTQKHHPQSESIVHVLVLKVNADLSEKTVIGLSQYFKNLASHIHCNLLVIDPVINKFISVFRERERVKLDKSMLHRVNPQIGYGAVFIAKKTHR